MEEGTCIMLGLLAVISCVAAQTDDITTQKPDGPRTITIGAVLSSQKYINVFEGAIKQANARKGEIL